MKLLELAADLTWVRELGQNDGPVVRAFQAINRGKPPDPWCADFVSFVLYVATRGKPPFALSGGCDELLAAARKAGRERDRPVAPGLFFVMKTPTDAHHTGFIVSTENGEFSTIEGNASDPTKPATNEGWGVFGRARVHKPGAYCYVSLEDLT